MNEADVKIAKIKKSCSVGKKICSILSVIAIVGCICALAGSITIFTMGKEFDEKVQQGIEAGIITEGNDYGASRMININVGTVKNMHSDIPALQEAIDDHPYCITYATYAIVMCIACAVVAVMLKFVGSVFDLIIKEDTPFTDKVIKRVVIVLIVISAVMFFTMSAGFGILGGIVTWVVYTILDYGKTLQIQSDETL